MTDACRGRSAAARRGRQRPGRYSPAGQGGAVAARDEKKAGGCPAGSTGPGRVPAPALPLVAEPGEAEVAHRAVAFQEALHRPHAERRPSAASASRRPRAESAGRASRMRRMRPRSGSMREARPPIRSGRTRPRSRKRRTQRRTLDAPKPEMPGRGGGAHAPFHHGRHRRAPQVHTDRAALPQLRQYAGEPVLSLSKRTALRLVLRFPRHPSSSRRADAALVKSAVLNPNVTFHPVRRRAVGLIRPPPILRPHRRNAPPAAKPERRKRCKTRRQGDCARTSPVCRPGDGQLPFSAA